MMRYTDHRPSADEPRYSGSVPINHFTDRLTCLVGRVLGNVKYLNLYEVRKVYKSDMLPGNNERLDHAQSDRPTGTHPVLLHAVFMPEGKDGTSYYWYSCSSRRYGLKGKIL